MTPAWGWSQNSAPSERDRRGLACAWGDRSNRGRRSKFIRGRIVLPARRISDRKRRPVDLVGFGSIRPVAVEDLAVENPPGLENAFGNVLCKTEPLAVGSGEIEQVSALGAETKKVAGQRGGVQRGQQNGHRGVTGGQGEQPARRLIDTDVEFDLGR